MQTSRFRLMTYNVGGGRRCNHGIQTEQIELIRDVQPDILALQEVTEILDADGIWHSALPEIARVCGFAEYYFAPTLTLREHLHLGKTIMVHGVLNDWQDWRYGNAVLCRWNFARLSDPARTGSPRSVPLFAPPRYEGNRNTEPRHAILARLGRAPSFPFVVGVHLTTLVGEREDCPSPDVVKEAQGLRACQTQRLLDLLRAGPLSRENLVFLLGDFNATESEPCLSEVFERDGGFVRLVPSRGPPHTHPVAGCVDHLFVYPPDRLYEYDCWTGPTSGETCSTDHLPVVAEVVIL